MGQSVTQLCDKRTFVVNFETVNALGQGRYYFGLAPNCPVEDAIVADWGNPLDPLQGAANDYISSGSCPVSGVGVKQQPAQQAADITRLEKSQPPLLLQEVAYRTLILFRFSFARRLLSCGLFRGCFFRDGLVGSWFLRCRFFSG